MKYRLDIENEAAKELDKTAAFLMLEEKLEKAYRAGFEQGVGVTCIAAGIKCREYDKQGKQTN